jgi:hypothetical protein
MSVEMDQGADAILQAARESASLDELSEVEVDGDGSSSLSDIEDKDPEQDEDAEASEDLSNLSDEENDSEAETERLEESPNKFRPQQDVVLSSHGKNQIYDRSPSKLHNQIIPNHQDDEEDDDPLSDDDMSINESPESPKSSPHDDPEAEPPTAPTSLEDSSGDNKKMLSVIETDTRKRKRSIMAGTGFDEDLGEPLRKRTGSVMTPADEYAIEDDINHDEEVDTSNPISGNISGDEGGAAHEEDPPEEVEEPAANDENAAETVDIPVSPKKRGRKKKKTVENGVDIHDEDLDAVADETALNGDDEVRNGEEDNADNEGDDEAEAALKNEEEREFLLWSHTSCPVALTGIYSREEANCAGAIKRHREAVFHF